MDLHSLCAQFPPALGEIPSACKGCNFLILRVANCVSCLPLSNVHCCLESLFKNIFHLLTILSTQSVLCKHVLNLNSEMIKDL